jgi:hypothetical protein
MAVTIMCPDSFEPVPNERPGIHKVFIRPGTAGKGMSFLSVSLTPTGLASGMGYRNIRRLRDRNGEWDHVGLESFWKGLAETIPGGVAETRTFLFKGYPAADMRLTTTVRTDGHPGSLAADMRLVLYGDALVRLECGDLSEEPVKTHAMMLEEVCLPFFGSLSFGEGGAAGSDMLAGEGDDR